MKTKNLYISLFMVMFFQTAQVQAGEVFYYFGDEKIYLTEKLDEVYIRLNSETANQENFENLITHISANLVTKPPPYWFGRELCVSISTKNGEDISQSVLEELKASELVRYVSYMLFASGQEEEFREDIAFIDEFVVLPKSTTSFEQLEALVYEHHCVIEINRLLGRESIISVPKTAELSMWQMANLFHETGLFEYSEPNIFYLKPFDFPTGLSDISISQPMLFQNVPNPFKEETEIRCALPEGTDKAEIHIFDLNGKLLKQYTIDNSCSVVVKSADFKTGMYIYSLNIDGKQIDTKKMILIQ